MGNKERGGDREKEGARRFGKERGWWGKNEESSTKSQQKYKKYIWHLRLEPRPSFIHFPFGQKSGLDAVSIFEIHHRRLDHSASFLFFFFNLTDARRRENFWEGGLYGWFCEGGVRDGEGTTQEWMMNTGHMIRDGMEADKFNSL